MPGFSLREFDVCLIPSRPGGLTADPVKLYEYFSLGKPVVATATRELSRFGDLLYLAGGPEIFISASTRPWRSAIPSFGRGASISPAPTPGRPAWRVWTPKSARPFR